MTTAFNPWIQIPHPESIAFAIPGKKKELDEIIKGTSSTYIFAVIILTGLAGAQFAAFHVGNVNGMIISGTAFGASVVTIAIFAVVNAKKGNERLEKFEEKRLAQDYSASEILQYSYQNSSIVHDLDLDNCVQFLFFLYSFENLDHHISFFENSIFFYIKHTLNGEIEGSHAFRGENENLTGTKWLTIKNRALALAPKNIKKDLLGFLTMIESGLHPAYYRVAPKAESIPEQSED